MTLRPEDYAVWYQFIFDYEVEFWGFLSAISDVRTSHVNRKDLINTSILLHKDRGVKAYAACCIADLLRLYAPEAPYNQNELRDIFQFFFRQLSTGLKGADSPYYNEYFHLLESLSTVKSVVLVCDLPNADDLIIEVFREFFGMIRRDLAKKLELFIADILIALIDESQNLPADVLEILMAQFMDKNAVCTNILKRVSSSIPFLPRVYQRRTTPVLPA